MLSSALLHSSIIALAVLVVAATAALFGHGVWLRFEAVWNKRRIATGREALYALMHDDRERVSSARRPGIALLRGLRPGTLERLVLSLARNLDPSASIPLHRVAVEIGLIERAERFCESRFWWRRLRGARFLSALGGGAEIMARLLHDPNPAVRAQAAEWAAEDPSPDMMNGLIEFLRHPAGSELFTVQDALLRAGSAAVPALVGVLESGSGTGVAAALQVAAARADPRFIPPAIRLCESPDPELRAGAAELLGATGGGEGTDVLMSLLDDEDPDVRAAAARALGRVRHWRSAPQLAGRMRDTSWKVRRAAGLALRSVGPPGLLVLKKMLSDQNSFAADMAQQVLDMPTAVGELRT